MKPNTQHDERKHAKFPPSSAKRWLHCPDSVILQPGVTVRGGSAAADEGTAAHMMAEDAQRTGQRGFDYILNGSRWRVNGVEYPATPDMADAVDLYLDTLAGYPNAVYRHYVEERVECPTINPDCSGTPDNWAYNERGMRLAIVDLKYGAGHPVEVIENGHPNEQLLVYAIGVTRELQARGFHVTHIDLVIVQPRCFHRDGPVRKCTLMEGHLAAYERAFAEATRKGGLCAGDWCRWCNNERVCPALLGDVDAILELSTHPVEALSLADVAEMLDIQPRINSYFAALKRYAQEQVMLGAEMPGWHIKTTTGNREFLSNAESLLLPVFGDAIYEPRELKSPAQIEKIKGGKAFLKENLLTTRKTGLGELVRITE